MPKKSLFGLTFCLCAIAILGQNAPNKRPEAEPWDTARMEMQPPPAQGLAVRAGRLFDPKSGTNLSNQIILIKGDRITDVGPAANIRIPQGMPVIDLSRATVLPGLIDHHVHLMREQPNDGREAYRGLHYALKNLNAGFTTLVDMGSPSSYAIVELRDSINKGWVPGPRLQVAGTQLNPRGAAPYPAPSTVVPFGFGPGAPVWQNAQNINGPWAARAAVRRARHG